MVASDNTTSDSSEKLTMLQVAGSTLAAAFGVQSKHTMKRDLTRGDIVQFIIAGIIFTTCFVIGLIMLVNWIV